MNALLSSAPVSILVLSPVRKLRQTARQTHHHDEAYWPKSWQKYLTTRQSSEGAAPIMATPHQALTRL